MARLADLSVEYAHLYLRQVTEDSAREAVSTAKRWLGPVIDRYRANGLTVSTTVMIDDYFTSDPAVVEDKTRMIEEACRAEGMQPDFLVYEGACASTVERLLERLVQEPRRGDGSAQGAASAPRREWLSNGSPGRSAPVPEDDESLLSTGTPGAVAAIPKQGDADSSSAPHAIHLDVEMYRATRDGRLYSCPLLAAWWQLTRLGMLRGPSGGPGIPERTKVSDASVPFAAQRTLTLLSPRFIEVEHAVRTILGQVNPRPEWLANLRLGRDEPGPGEPVRRIAYLFLPEGYDPTRAATT
jgi:hypothetical protein